MGKLIRITMLTGNRAIKNDELMADIDQIANPVTDNSSAEERGFLGAVRPGEAVQARLIPRPRSQSQAATVTHQAEA